MKTSELICKVEDDNGVVCNNKVSKRQWAQDGMCPRCADGLWDTFSQPRMNGHSVKPFIFADFTTL